jgi:hypothetical protein
MNRISVKISFKASGLYGIDLQSVQDMKSEIREHYISNISENGGPQAGGLVDALVEIILDIPFQDFFKIMHDGFLFDTVTRGKESFLLKPLIQAMRSIEKKNELWDYHEVRFLFNDTEVVILGIQKLFTSTISSVFNALFIHHQNLQQPYRIIIPLIKSIEENNEVFQRIEGGWDFSEDDFLKYWGIEYDLGHQFDVYDLEKGVLLNKPFEYY